MKKNNFYVIGNDYRGDFCCYGGTPTLIGAKRLANKKAEYSNDCGTWVSPPIFRAEDTELIDGERVPKKDAEGFYVWPAVEAKIWPCTHYQYN